MTSTGQKQNYDGIERKAAAVVEEIKKLNIGYISVLITLEGTKIMQTDVFIPAKVERKDFRPDYTSIMGQPGIH